MTQGLDVENRNITLHCSYKARNEFLANSAHDLFLNTELLSEASVKPSVAPLLLLFSDGNQGSGGSRKRSRKKSEEEETTWDSDSEV